MKTLKALVPLLAVFSGAAFVTSVAPSLSEPSNPDSPVRVAQYWDTCGQMGWEDVDSFETDDFFVSICREGDVLHLVGEAKDLSGFVDLPVFETRDRRYAVREGEDVMAVNNEMLIGLQEVQSEDGTTVEFDTESDAEFDTSTETNPEAE